MTGPKFSEILRAAARGYLDPYMPSQQSMQPQGYGGQSMGPVFDTSDYQNAKSVAAALNAMALVYAKYEQIDDALSNPQGAMRSQAEQIAKLRG